MLDNLKRSGLQVSRDLLDGPPSIVTERKPLAMETIDFKKHSSALLTPLEFLRLPKEEKDNILSTRIQPPTPGKKGFGGIIVEYKSPIYSADLTHE